MATFALGEHLREARRSRGWTQQRAAARLGVTQAYLSMLERGARDAAPLAQKLVRVYGLEPTALPVNGRDDFAFSDPALQLAEFGYPGFSHLSEKSKPKLNPAAFLLSALGQNNLEARVVEALPWLVARYPEMPFEWLSKECCARTLQNRLGFAVSLAQAAAPDDRFLPWLEKLADCKLTREDAFCSRLNEVEKRWLRGHASPEAKQWNLLSTLRPDSVRYVR